MKFLSFFFVICLGCLMMAGCYYDNEEELYPDTSCPDAGLSFSADVQPIIQQNCISGCHSNVAQLGSISLEGYDKVLIFVNNGKLLSSIKHDGNASNMPLNGNKLGACLIQKVEVWISEGAQNN